MWVHMYSTISAENMAHGNGKRPKKLEALERAWWVNRGQPGREARGQTPAVWMALPCVWPLCCFLKGLQGQDQEMSYS